MNNDILTETQAQVTRIRDMITTTKILLPDGNVNFGFYELELNQAEKAIREHDTVSLIRLLPELKGMH